MHGNPIPLLILLLFGTLPLLRAVESDPPTTPGPDSTSHGHTISVAEPDIVTARKTKKSKDEIHYKTLTLAKLTEFVPGKTPVTIYGGRSDGLRRATGFFRTEQVDGRWYFIDPAGGRFINVAANTVAVSDPPEDTAAFARRFGNRVKWANQTKTDLSRMGFNSLGCWSDDKSFKEAGLKIPYMPRWNFMARYAASKGIVKREGLHTNYQNGCVPVFDPEFEAFCERESKALEATKDDPWIIGHFSDNELPFKQGDMIKNYLSMPAGDANRVAVETWLAEHNKTGQTVSPEDNASFCTMVMTRYFQVVSAAIRRHDPNHLFVGSRFHGGIATQRASYIACGPYVDVVSVNYYGRWTPEQAELNQWAKISQRPIILTEWYAKGDDAGLNDIAGAGFSVATQADRGKFYENFVIGALRNPNCIGFHWFRWSDDASNTPANKGIYSKSYEPYPPLVMAMTAINPQVYRLMDHLAGARSPNLINGSIQVKRGNKSENKEEPVE